MILWWTSVVLGMRHVQCLCLFFDTALSHLRHVGLACNCQQTTAFWYVPCFAPPSIPAEVTVQVTPSNSSGFALALSWTLAMACREVNFTLELRLVPAAGNASNTSASSATVLLSAAQVTLTQAVWALRQPLALALNSSGLYEASLRAGTRAGDSNAVCHRHCGWWQVIYFF